MASERPFLANIALIGDINVGKTSLLLRFASETFSDLRSHTILNLVPFTQLTVHLSAGFQGVDVQLWDTAGAERFLRLSPPFYRKSEGIVLAYSTTCRSSFANVPRWATAARNEAPNAVFLLVGTKTDLKREREVSYCEGAQLAESLGVAFLETSAKTGDNVDSAFFGLLCGVGPLLGFQTSLGFVRNRQFT